MAAKGSEAKSIIIKEILNHFEGSFLVDGKEIRIPMIENNELIQIKVGLTCAKENISNPNGENFTTAETAPTNETTTQNIELTEKEKADVKKMMETLGF